MKTREHTNQMTKNAIWFKMKLKMKKKKKNTPVEFYSDKCGKKRIIIVKG